MQNLQQRILDDPFACYKKLDPMKYVLHYMTFKKWNNPAKEANKYIQLDNP